MTDFTSLFSPHDFDKNDCIILSYFKNEIDKTKFSDQAKFRLDEIKKIKVILAQKSIKENYAVKN